MLRVFVRVLVAAVAVLLAAWLGVLLRNAMVAQSAGDRIFFTPALSAGELDRELDRLESARLLDPDPGVDELRAGLLWLRGRPAESARVAKALVRSEPQNVHAWMHLYRATVESHPRQAAFALSQVRRLNPLAGTRLAPAPEAGSPPASAAEHEEAPRR